MAGTSSDQEAIWLVVPISLVNFTVTLVALAFVEKVGRKILLLVSLAGVTVSLLLLAVAFYLEVQFSPAVSLHPANITSFGCTTKHSHCYSCVQDSHCGFCFFESRGSKVINGSCLPVKSMLNTDHSMYGRCNVSNSFSWSYDHCPTSMSWLTMGGLVLYLVWYAPGLGAMPWTINSEIYPQWARSFGNSSSTTTNWVFNLLVSMTFLPLTEWLTKCGTFVLYFVISISGWVFVYYFLPETKGKSLEEVTKLFHGH